ncbi:YibE/F family protein [Nocardioides salsibiostraticola]
MGAGHSHAAHRQGDDALLIERGPRAVLLGFLALCALVTAIGLVTLWPDADRSGEVLGSQQFATETATFPTGTISEIGPDGAISVVIDNGERVGDEVVVQNIPPEVGDVGLEVGDRLELIRTPATDQTPEQINYFGIERDRPLLILFLMFVAVVLVVARLRGFLALVSLGFAGLVMGYFILPGLLTGESPVLVALVGSSAILYVVLYITHGLSIRTSAALAGTLGGLAITAAVGLYAIGATRLTGVTDEGSRVLTSSAPDIALSQLLLAAVVIAGLGVLNDVTITQSSAVWELRSAAPTMSRATLFASGMRIGRDHIASTIYTIVFAYAGTALTVLLVIQLFDRPLLDLIATEEIAEEIVRSLVSSIGLVLAVPLTTVIAALTVPGPRSEDHVS